MKISEWLLQIDSHAICGSQDAKDDFQKETGQCPTWPEHTREQTARGIKERGLGGSVMVGPSRTMMCFGWEMAEALARKYAEFGGSCYEGRGRRFWAAIEALQAKGL